VDDWVYEKYMRAGKIAASARNYGANLVKPGISFLEVANKIETKITKEGAGLAFPVNISVNELAAHYSPRHDDKLVFKKGDVVKLDVGVHVDGYIADTAVTVEVETNKYGDMIKASSDALDVAINLMKDGAELSLVGKNIQETIESFGYKPINNLTGHSLEQYSLHSGISVPNVSEVFNKSRVTEGNVLAIEPFSTNGAGHVVSGHGSNIYLCGKSLRSHLVRDNRSKVCFNKMKSQFKTLPFAQRWCEKSFNNSDVVLRRLTFLGLLTHYSQLVEAGDGIVTQKEHTVIIREDGCEVTTK
jgi:methionyl aminopeptidase